MPTINGQGITRGAITRFEQWDWFGDVSTVAGALIPNGSRVDIVIENVTLSGAIVRGNVSGDTPRYQLAGRPEWGTQVKPRPYQSSGTVLRSTVFGDIAREALGASWQSIVVAPPESKLGGHYERVGSSGSAVMLARDAIGSLGLPWYVRDDGVTVFSARPGGTVATAERILVSRRNDAIGLRYVNCDDVAAFVPGLTFEGEVIGELSYLIEPEDVSLQVWTRAASNAFADLVRLVWRRLFPRVELQGLFSYSTAGVTEGGKHSLRSTKSRHLPDIRVADAWTIAGHTADLTPGTRVLVAFADGDPASPVIVAVDPSTAPQMATFGAVASIGLDALSVDLGAATSPVVVDNGLAAWVTAVTAGLAAQAPPVVVTPPATLTSTKVKA